MGNRFWASDDTYIPGQLHFFFKVPFISKLDPAGKTVLLSVP
ncbi:MAG TPA: hypothetical protein VKE70_37465 [Candidatus Solibacter sp.]|nr:hypothetical protein [Candidatus Solibacter sp.]